MGKDKENFIFRRAHRRLTYTSILAILPLLVTGLTAGVLVLADVAFASQVLEFIVALPTWGLAILWLVLPVLSAVLARRGYQQGTLYRLRSWNGFTYKLALALLVGEAVVILLQIF